jgi:5'-nucleotidase
MILYLARQINMTKRIIIPIDMDNVLVNFQSGIDAMPKHLVEEYAGDLDEIPGIFSQMQPLDGAVEAYKKLTLTHNEHLLIGDYKDWASVLSYFDSMKLSSSS